MAWLMVGMYLAKSVHLEQIACKLLIRAKKLNLSRRLRRFLKNDAGDVSSWYASSAQFPSLVMYWGCLPTPDFTLNLGRGGAS